MSLTTRTDMFSLTPAERIRDRIHFSFTSDGANPSSLLDLLAALVKDGTWKELGFDSFGELVAAPFPSGFGIPVPRLRTLLGFKHRYEDESIEVAERMADMRKTVTDLLGPEIAVHGTNQHSGGRDTVTSSGRGNSANYILGRLKRDRPDLAELVLDGEMSARAAAIEAGFRHRTISIPVDDIDATARALRRHLSAEALIDLTARLGGA